MQVDVSAANSRSGSSPVLSQATIFRFWYPLAVSWLFMALEGPVAVSVISRRPFPEANTAAYLVMMGISIWIEGPIIDLLATSTTLAADGAAYRSLRRFTLALMAFVTVAHIGIVFSPLYGLVTHNLMGLQAEVANFARPGMMLLTPWSAIIGWRRFLQGILIRNGETKLIGRGTTMRALTMVTTSVVLFRFATFPSVITVAIGLMASIIAEALYIQLAIRSLLLKKYVGSGASIPLKRLISFHIPLTLTTMLNIVAVPIIAAGLARTPNPVLVLAGFQVCSTIGLLFRMISFCLPEVIVTLYRDATSLRCLQRFCLKIGIGASGVSVLLALSGLDEIIFARMLGASPDVVKVAHATLLVTSAVPFLDAIHGLIRGALTAHHCTAPRMAAVVVGTGTMVAVLGIGIALKVPGPLLAASSLFTSVLSECLLLGVVWRRGNFPPLPTRA